MPSFSWYRRGGSDLTTIEGTRQGRYIVTDNETHDTLPFFVLDYFKYSNINIVAEDEVLPREKWFEIRVDNLEAMCMKVVTEKIRDRYEDLATLDFSTARKLRDELRSLGLPWKMCANMFFSCIPYSSGFPYYIHSQTRCPKYHSITKKTLLESYFCRECGDELIHDPSHVKV